MDRNKANRILASILETVSEIKGGAPSGVMYAALLNHCSLEEYQGLIEIAQSVGLISVSAGHLVTLEPKGFAMVEKIRASRGEVRS